MLFLNVLKHLHKTAIHNTRLTTSSLHTYHVTELRLKEFGDYENVLELNKYELDESQIQLKRGELFVKLLAAPINPADMNVIQGRYGILPKVFPTKIGNEGLFEVLKVDSDENRFKVGDWLLPVVTELPSWQSHAIAHERQFLKVPSNLDRRVCATLKVNPVTAHRLLLNFKDLKPNDTIVQNGANSGVGQAVIQLAKSMKLNVVNIVRKRPSDQANEELNAQLRDLGAKYIFTEEDLRNSHYLTKDLWNEIPKPTFALNCVGGKATSDMVRLLGMNATIVTYGRMSNQPLTFNTADFIFKNLQAVGFWLTPWRSENEKEFEKSLEYLCDLIAKGQFKAPKCEEFKLDDYKEAFNRAKTPFVSSKILFIN
jgi:trans-2-enoyl-CoA reductase